VEMAISATEFVWRPLFEAAGQTLAGIVGSYATTKLIDRYFRQNTFDGAMDLWHRGIQANSIGEGDSVRFDGLISPYTQLFPCDPFTNAQRWNNLYQFTGRISSAEYQSMEFFAGSDAALRVGSLNGESVVGLYGRYGFVGEGMVGVVPTSVILKAIPDFFAPNFIGTRAIVTGRLSRCPGQHAYIIQAIAQRAGVRFDVAGYRNTWYLKVDSVRPFRNSHDNTVSLLGSIWAATEVSKEQYLVQYGYLTNQSERQACVAHLQAEKSWKKARIYCDEIDCPSQELSFKRAFL
jgi:hypothetical protein